MLSVPPAGHRPAPPDGCTAAIWRDRQFPADHAALLRICDVPPAGHVVDPQLATVRAVAGTISDVALRAKRQWSPAPGTCGCIVSSIEARTARQTPVMSFLVS